MVPNCATHHTYVHRGVRNFAYVLNGWPLIKVWIQLLQWTDIWRKNNMNFSFQPVLMVYTLTLQSWPQSYRQSLVPPLTAIAKLSFCSSPLQTNIVAVERGLLINSTARIVWCLVSNLVPSASFIIRRKQNRNEILKLFWWRGRRSVHKMVKHTLKILQHLLQDF